VEEEAASAPRALKKVSAPQLGSMCHGGPIHHGAEG